MYNNALRQKAIMLRKKGLSYSLIQEKLKVKIPKSTFSYWCRNVTLRAQYWENIKKNNLRHLSLARALSKQLQRAKREDYLRSVIKKNLPLRAYLNDQNVAKLALAVLYLGEGSKSIKRAGVVFGNSDPAVISLFLKLFRYCYQVDESKFRCTVQCRADQSIPELNDFWSKITAIPLAQFYGARVDTRSKGKKTKRKNY